MRIGVVCKVENGMQYTAGVFDEEPILDAIRRAKYDFQQVFNRKAERLFLTAGGMTMLSDHFGIQTSLLIPGQVMGLTIEQTSG